MKDLGFSEEKVRQLSRRMVHSRFWEEMDLGITRMEDAKAYFLLQMPEYEQEISAFWAHIEDIVEEYPYAEDLICRLKDAGFHVYALSNYPDKMADIHWKNFRFLSHMDGWLISSKEHLAKPNPAFYRLLESRFGASLKKSVFVDDLQRNIDAAKALGMDGILFESYESLARELKERRILPG